MEWKIITSHPWKIFWPVPQMSPDKEGFIHGIDYKYEGSMGVFNTYTGAMAAQMGLWEEFCEFHRTKD